MKMTFGDKRCLDIYLAKGKVGQLILDTDTDQLSLEYDPQWKKKGFALSPHLPLADTLNPIAWVRFLNNLLPEGNGFESLLENYRISKHNTFGLIKLIGADTASGLSFYPSGHGPGQQYTFRPIPETELIKRLDHRDQQNLIVWDGKP